MQKINLDKELEENCQNCAWTTFIFEFDLLIKTLKWKRKKSLSFILADTLMFIINMEQS